MAHINQVSFVANTYTYKGIMYVYQKCVSKVTKILGAYTANTYSDKNASETIK